MDSLGQVLLVAQQLRDVAAQVGTQPADSLHLQSGGGSDAGQDLPEIWILPSSSERETYSLFSLTDGHAPSRHSFRVCGDLVHYCTTAEAL